MFIYDTSRYQMLFDYYYDYGFKAVWTAALRGEVHLRPSPLLHKEWMIRKKWQCVLNVLLCKMIVCLHIFLCLCTIYGLNILNYCHYNFKLTSALAFIYLHLLSLWLFSWSSKDCFHSIVSLNCWCRSAALIARRRRGDWDGGMTQRQEEWKMEFFGKRKVRPCPFIPP